MTKTLARRLILKTVGAAGAALAGLAFGALAFSAPAQADTLDDIRKAGKVRVAIDLAIPPFGMTDDKMQPAGSDVDLAPRISASSSRSSPPRGRPEFPSCRPTRPISSSRRCRSRPSAPR